MINDKRRFGRVNISINVICRIYPQKEKIYKFLSRDISVGGIKILMDKDAGLKTNVELGIYISGSPVIILGEIVWQKTGQIGKNNLSETGIKFTCIKREYQEKIEGMMSDI